MLLKCGVCLPRLKRNTSSSKSFLPSFLASFTSWILLFISYLSYQLFSDHLSVEKIHVYTWKELILRLCCETKGNIRQVYKNVLNSFPLPINIWWYRRLTLLPSCFYSIAGMVHATPTYTTSIPTLIKYLSQTFLFFSEVEINCKLSKL